jgi:hypothetical protein
MGWRVIRITSADLRGTGLTRLLAELASVLT